MMIPWKYNEYFDMDGDTKEFTQRMLFLEYVEEWEQLSFKNREYLSLTAMFLDAQDGYEEDEEYETCQLFKDTYQRFKSEFKDLG
jgi:hypothetical protein